MRLKKRFMSLMLITTAAAITLSISPIVQAASEQTGATNDTTVVAKDTSSGAVVFKKQGSYYFGIDRSNQIVTKGRIAPREFIVKMKGQTFPLVDQDNNPVATIAKKFAAKTEILNSNLGLSIFRVANDKDYISALQTLSKNPEVQYAEPNYIFKAESIPNDPYYSQEWGAKTLQAEAAWDKVPLSKRANVTIAILDTGINAAHEDLKNSIVPGYDFVNNDTNPADGQGHGTHVSGIAAAVANNALGIAGIAGGSKIMPIKVLDDTGSGDTSTIIQGIKYAADHGAQIINMSLGGQGTSSAMQDAINYATGKGVTVVAASGNENGAVDMPGNCQNVIAVGAIASNNQRASYSNFGPELDVVTPGTQIYSTYIGGPSSYTNMSGTSMATPFATGVAALIKAANPSLSPAAVTNILHQSATDLGTSGFDNYYGYGLVNASKAVDLAMQGTTPAPSPTPTPTPAPAPYPGTSGNLAWHKTAVASSIEGPTRTAVQAFDGNSTTRWASQAGVDPQWIYMDLGRIYNINKIVLKWEKAYAKSYQVQISYDGRTWYNVYSTNSGIGGTTTLTGSVNGRFVRMNGTQRGTPYGYSLWEFEVYGN